jgi:small subunit ribosomal protein S6
MKRVYYLYTATIQLEEDTDIDKFIFYLTKLLSTGYEDVNSELTPKFTSFKSADMRENFIDCVYWQEDKDYLTSTLRDVFNKDDRIQDYSIRKSPATPPIFIEKESKMVERRYFQFDTVIMLDAKLAHEEVNRIKEKYLKFISSPALLDAHAETVQVEDLGKRELAYEIKHCKYAYYLQFTYWQNRGFIEQLERQCRVDDDIIKFITIRTDAEAEDITVDDAYPDWRDFDYTSEGEIEITEQIDEAILNLKLIFNKYRKER